MAWGSCVSVSHLSVVVFVNGELRVSDDAKAMGLEPLSAWPCCPALPCPSRVSPAVQMSRRPQAQ